MGVKSHLILSVSMVLLLLVACEKIPWVEQGRLRSYHDDRWTVAALGSPSEQPVFDATMVVPGRLGMGLDEQYQALSNARLVQAEAWAALDSEIKLDLLFVDELLAVLVSRDASSIERLAPQVGKFQLAQQQSLRRWQDAQLETAAKLRNLRDCWDTAWPEHDLSFELCPDTEADPQLEASAVARRQAELRAFHHAEYDRLAFVYLGYEPQTTPQPSVAVPPGCDELHEAIRRLESALSLRSSLDEAIANDITQLSELTGLELAGVPWEAVELPRGHRARKHAAAALARLQLLKLLDEVLTGCLDVYILDVNTLWQEVWPDTPLVTNLLAYAGLKPSAAQTADPLLEITFRK